MASDAGPVFFAWVEPEETTFGLEHAREDEHIIRFLLEQSEGDFAKLTIDIRNPRIGPLAPDRPVWAWFSWQTDSDIQPLFFGRLVGIPSNILGEVITYVLIAKPGDFGQRKDELAASLRVLPNYDELFVNESLHEDPDAVLEGYSATWHIDRLTHEVTISDFLIGEDGVVTFTGTGDALYSSVQLTLEGVPLSSVTVKGEVPWTQLAPSGARFEFGPIRFISFTGNDGGGWPKAGDNLAGGYYCIDSNVVVEGTAETTTQTYQYQNQAKKHRDNDVMSINESKTEPIGFYQEFRLLDERRQITGDPHTGTPASGHVKQESIAICQQVVTANFTLGIALERDRLERVSVTLSSDLQPVLSDGSSPQAELIELNAADVGKECDSVEPAIVNSTRSQYVTTDRGLSSIQYMINVARAKLIFAARAARVSFDCPFGFAAGITCRKNARLFDDRIPGGDALGKVVYYSMRGDGASGEFLGSVVIACAIGLGNSISESSGTADYVDESYVDDYQTFSGQVVALPSGDIGYSPPVLVHGTSGRPFPFSKSQIVVREEIKNGDVQGNVILGNPITPYGRPENVQQQIDQYKETARKLAQALAAIPVWYELELRDLTQQGVEAEFDVETTNLVIPRQIDLMASASV